MAPESINRMKTEDWSELIHFSAGEFDHPGEMSVMLMHLLDDIRDSVGMPIYITSDFRRGDKGAHGSGLAVDIAENLQGKPISSRWRFLVLRAAFIYNVQRIGIYDKHIHIDVSISLPQKVCWWSKSK